MKTQEKLLFITSSDVRATANGGELCTNRNYLSFTEILEDKNVKVINLMDGKLYGLKNAIRKRINFLFGFHEGITLSRLKEICDLARETDYVFIDTSTYGIIAKSLKKRGYAGTIITFFHNVEYKIKLQKLRYEPWKILEPVLTERSERLGCKYSDKVVALNERDARVLQKKYKRNDIEIIPISLIDKYKEGEGVNDKISIPPKLLFTGNKWYANINGINWFIDHVLDKVDVRLLITGRKMDELIDKYTHPKIDFLGFVDDLAVVIKQSDIILTPIFEGSGMKVKTCEAMMFGKHIIGTPESFEGYDVDPAKVGKICTSEQDFITAIQEYSNPSISKFNHYSRDIYLEKYSFQATLIDFKKLLTGKL